MRSNRLLFGASSANLYATLAAVRLAPDGTAEIATAGHPPVVVLGRDGAWPVATRGFPIGLFGEAEYDTAVVPLEPGDAMVLYTDGVSESVDSHGNELGVERLVRALSAVTDRSPEAIVEAAVEAASLHRGATVAHDDLTVAAVRRA